MPTKENSVYKAITIYMVLALMLLFAYRELKHEQVVKVDYDEKRPITVCKEQSLGNSLNSVYQVDNK